MQDDGYIEYFGRQDDIIPFMKKSYCTIHPSYYPEGMSNVLLETAATGRPIIASNIAGCKETFEEGISGIGFEPKDGKSLFLAVERFIELPYDKKRMMGIRGREKIEKEFDRNIVIAAYINQINIIKEKKSNV